MFTVLVLEVADFLVHLPQLVLQLLDVALALFNRIVPIQKFLVSLNQDLLLVLGF